MNTIESIENNKIIAIARKIYGDDLKNLANALVNGGINNIELTFDQADSDCIARTCDSINLIKNIENINVGVGTVLNIEQLYAANNAGAKYIVSPNADIDLIKTTKSLGLVSIPGAITPTEIIYAYKAGADFVKIFPAGALGIEYIKAVCVPLNHIGFIANAGVTPDNICEFFDAGFIAAGISNYLCNPQLVKEHNWSEIEKRAKNLINIARKYNDLAR